MLIPFVIWISVALTSVVPKSSYGETFHVWKAYAMEERTEISRKAHQLQMTLEAPEIIEKVSGVAMTRENTNLQLHDWLSEAQAQEVRAAEQYYSPFAEHISEEPYYQSKSKCIQWLEQVTGPHEIQLLSNSLETLDNSSYQLRECPQAYSATTLLSNFYVPNLDKLQRGNRLAFNHLIDEYFERLPKEQQKQLLYYVKGKDPFTVLCRVIWEETVNYARRKRYVDEEYNGWVLWMTSEQKHELERMRNNGSTFGEIHKKVNEYFTKLPEAVQKELTSDYEEKCNKYFTALANKDEIRQLEVHDETNHEEYEKAIGEILSRQPEDVRSKAYKFYQICDDIYHKERGRSKRGTDVPIEKWFTPKHESKFRRMRTSSKRLSATKQNGISGTGKELHATEKTEQYCYAWLENVTSLEERIELTYLCHNDWGTCKRKVQEYINRLSLENQEATNKKLQACESIQYNYRIGQWLWLPLPIHAESKSRSKRDLQRHSLVDHFQTHLSWLTDTQKNEIKKLKDERKTKIDIQKKIFDYYEELSGDEKKSAGEKLLGGCRELLKQIVGDEKMAELKEMKDSAVSYEELEAKVEGMLENVTDQAKKQKIHVYGPLCRKIYGDRQKRDLHGHSLEDYFQTHLSWLTDTQKNEIKKLKDEGKTKIDIQKKIFDYYEELSGDEKKSAGEKLLGGCSELLKQIVGDEKMAELKEMKDSAVSYEELEAKVEGMLENVTDQAKKQKIHVYGPLCRRISETLMRRNKRDLRDAIDYYKSPSLQYLADQDYSNIRKVIGENKPKVDMIKAILSYHDNVGENDRKRARKLLRLGCEEIIRSSVFENRLNELQTLESDRSDGSTMSEMMMLAVTNGKAKLMQIRAYQSACSKLLGLGHLVKRHEHTVHLLDNYLEGNLKWLSAEQKEELRKMGRDGKSRIYMLAKLFHYYDELFEQPKWDVSDQLNSSCRQILKEVIGENYYNELTKMKDSGADMNALKAKVDAALNEVSDEDNKGKIKIYRSRCMGIFTGIDYKHSSEKHFNSDLKWLTKKERDELLMLMIMMMEGNKSEADIQGKILHVYAGLSDKAKKGTVEFFIHSYDDMVAHLFGDERAAELKILRKLFGVTDGIRRKMDAVINEITKKDRGVKAREYGSICKKMFIDFNDKHNENTLEHYFPTPLKWLSETQKSEINKMKSYGKSHEEIQHKIFEFFGSADSQTKKYATKSLVESCREIFIMIGGEEKADELCDMIQTDTNLNVKQIEEKIASIIDSVDDQWKKAYAKAYVTPCMHLYTVNMRRHQRRI